MAVDLRRAIAEAATSAGAATDDCNERAHHELGFLRSAAERAAARLEGHCSTHDGPGGS